MRRGVQGIASAWLRKLQILHSSVAQQGESHDGLRVRPRGHIGPVPFLSDTVENLLARSFPNPGDEHKIIDLFRASIADDRLGIPVRRDGDKLEYAYPVAILAALRG